MNENNVIPITNIINVKKINVKNMAYTWYHDTDRGAGRKTIFHDDEDREKFLSLLAESIYKFDIALHAFCLMDNHFHLLIWNNGTDHSEAIHNLKWQYSRYFNDKYDTDGPLWKNNYDAEPIEDDEHLYNTFKYIHNNPSNGVCDERVKNYAWSSYQMYFGDAKPPEWLTTGYFKNHFRDTIENTECMFGYEMFKYVNLLQNIDAVLGHPSISSKFNTPSKLLTVKIFLAIRNSDISFAILSRYYEAMTEQAARKRFERFSKLVTESDHLESTILDIEIILSRMSIKYKAKLNGNNGGVKKYSA